ncbi:hypothetical protein WME90_28740 [Sorangium sp. So ce375]|uniref:hypothetical protein n=1 Tax=Sorangium sp. So ce375 TaxID=3133306 RepID=UPI003F5C01D4
MHSEAICSWLDDAIRDLARLREGAGPALRRRLDAALGRIARMNGGEGVRDALERPGATPFVRLVDAAAVDFGLAGDPRAGLVGRATVMEYLYVRLQDDLVDEEAIVDRASVYAMEAALAFHLALLAEAQIPRAAWLARSRLMARFADTSAQEIDERCAPDGMPAERAGEKFLGMAIPLIALASFAGRDDLHDDLSAFVVHLGAALQMVNDILNAAEDRAAGRTTPLLRWIGAVDGGDANTLRAALLGHPATARALDLARAEAERAAALAGRRGLERLAALAQGARATVDRTSERLLGQMLGIHG